MLCYIESYYNGEGIPPPHTCSSNGPVQIYQIRQWIDPPGESWSEFTIAYAMSSSEIKRAVRSGAEQPGPGLRKSHP